MEDKYEIKKIKAELDNLKEKLDLYYKYATHLYENEIDFDISKRIKLLILKTKDLNETSIQRNIEAFYFLMELWNKEMEEVEAYFRKNNINTNILN